MLNKFVLQFPDELCNLFFLLVSKNSSRHLSDTSDVTPKNFHPQSKQTLNKAGTASQKIRLSEPRPTIRMKHGSQTASTYS